MVSQDFAPADAFYEPAQDTLVLGLPPLLTVFIVMLLLAAGLFGWWLGQKPGRAPRSAGKEIWKAVDEAIRATMTSHSDGLVDRARALRRVIQDKLGKTLALTTSFASLAALDKALAPPSDPADTHAHGDDHGGGHGDDGRGHPPTSDQDDSHATQADPYVAPHVVIERASQVVIQQPRARPTPTRPTTPPPPQTEAQRRETIRKAVSDMNDHWRLKEARIAEIDDAYDELSGPR